MTGQSRTLMAMTAAALITVASAITPAAGQTPAPAPRLQPAFRGDAQIEMTPPQVKRTEKELVTTFKVKNLMKQPLAGFKIEEFWYDAKGTVIGGDTFRYPKPLQPDEIITITLTDPLTGKERNNNYKFSHGNGAVKPTKVPKL
jgi:hypothetical protein